MTTATQPPPAFTYEEDDLLLSTMNNDGTRRWLRPKLSRGRFLTWRRWTAYALIVLFTVVPFLRIGGKPVILLDVTHRIFVFFGATFLPTDTVLLMLFLIGALISIFLITALLGRSWCGWACPQTVYMEFLYRPLERLFDGSPGRGKPLGGRFRGPLTLLKYATFLVASFYLANTFLAYFVGTDELLRWVRRSPFEHPGPFLVMAVTTGLMMFDFAFFREQTCIVACPYGRVQAVLLDRHSLVISYDPRRGEPRGKLRREEARGARGVELPTLGGAPERRGDCIDCKLCITTCPTGIDIRRGLQLECVACAQCIDACDDVMDKIGRPRGLIRYSSQAAIERAPHRVLRPRVVLYPLILTAVAALFGFAVWKTPTAEVALLRNPGAPFLRLEDGRVANELRLKIVNREERPASFRVEKQPDAPVEIVMQSNPIAVAAEETRTEGVRVIAAPGAFRSGKLDVRVRVTNEYGFAIDIPCRLLGPE